VSALPLAGRRVLVTRAAQQAGKLSEGLRALGAEPVEVPVLEIVAPESYAQLDDALRNLERYDWLILTSTNTLQAVSARSSHLGINPANAEGVKVAAIGSATAEAARHFGFQVAVVPASYIAESLVESLREQVAGKRVLLARAAIARDVIPDALRAAGAEVDVVDAYRNVLPDAAPTKLRHAVAAGLDVATFTSSSSVTHLAEAARIAGIPWPFAGVPAVSIGPITSQTLRDLDWPPAAEADSSDIPGLIAAVVRVLTPSNSDEVLTARLRLAPATQESLRLELNDAPAFAALLGATLPEDWPPGEYDRDAIQFFLERMIESGKDTVGWYGWYAILDGEEPAALVGCGGYLGPPDEAGCVEIGYSISEQWRGQGLAKELVQSLVNRAWTFGARKIVAHTTEANPASIAVLRSCGFQQAISSETEQLHFEIVRPAC
jgi:uroporphyrinogen-III synthase/uroporphyrinogen III methyltransferase/synthase